MTINRCMIDSYSKLAYQSLSSIRTAISTSAELLSRDLTSLKKSISAVLQFSLIFSFCSSSTTQFVTIQFYFIISISVFYSYPSLQLGYDRIIYSILLSNLAFFGFILQFHRFFIVLSVLPGKQLEIIDHLCPNALTPKARIHSQSILQSSFLTPSLK